MKKGSPYSFSENSTLFPQIYVNLEVLS